MKHRQTILVSLATVMVAGYWYHQTRQDTIRTAAEKFGRAVLAADTDSLWNFVPQNDRKFYGFDKLRFASFWSQAVAPGFKRFNCYRISTGDSNGLEVEFWDSRQRGYVNPNWNRASLLVSGQMGDYYSPYLVTCSISNVSVQDPKEVRTDSYVRFAKMDRWLTSHRTLLENMGITKICRGPAFEKGQTIDQILSDYRRAQVELKKRVAVASL
ncbi:MAG: hypothetical protein JST12_03790 [Armatimonadetes bacterium]|nr:hypothetical protein [Armatimonadota bacterium]